MSDDLIERLDQGGAYGEPRAAGTTADLDEAATEALCSEASARIRELEARIRELEAAQAGVAGNDLPRPKMRDTSVGGRLPPPPAKRKRRGGPGLLAALLRAKGVSDEH